MHRILAVALALSLPVTSEARGKFAAYEGRDPIREGDGGTKITTDGIDFWADGWPPRKYRVIGVITDQRVVGPLRPDALGSHGSARLVREHGGDAAVLMSLEDMTTGSIGFGQATSNGNATYGAYSTTRVNRAITRLAVIAYVQ